MSKVKVTDVVIGCAAIAAIGLSAYALCRIKDVEQEVVGVVDFCFDLQESVTDLQLKMPDEPDSRS